MKNPVLLLFIGVLISCNQNEEKKSFTIDGEISGISSGMVYLLYSDIKDSVEIQNEQFHFNGTLQNPEKCKIEIKEYKLQKEFYLENSEISFIGHIDSLDKAIITGSKTEDENLAYKKMLEIYERKFSDIENEYKSANENNKKKLETLYEKTDKEMVDAQKQFIKDNPTSFLCIKILQDIDWCFTSGKEYNEYISILDPSLNKYSDLEDLREQAARLEKVDIGQIAPNFEISDLNGENVILSDKYSDSKYLLLDFWASTCGPCRIENKHILEAYKKYHDNGFDILSVSTDTKKDLWLRAIEKDGLIWTNTCNLENWNNNELVKIYALRQVSANFLLDSTGKIIASNLRGDDLHSKLSELFNEAN